jgi:transcriptional regulator with XRE-family HTH domain
MKAISDYVGSQALSDVIHISMRLTIEQCRAGRGLLNWSAQDLAKAAGLGVASVRRFEGGDPVHGDTLGKIAVAFEYAGVVLIDAGTASKPAGPGARLLRDPG